MRVQLIEEECFELAWYMQEECFLDNPAILSSFRELTCLVLDLVSGVFFLNI